MVFLAVAHRLKVRSLSDLIEEFLDKTGVLRVVLACYHFDLARLCCRLLLCVDVDLV